MHNQKTKIGDQIFKKMMKTAPSEDDTKFSKSVQDLKELCSQLHYAADSYQSTFLNSNQKQLVLKNTKEYIHNALVTVVDHLGSVSANLDHHLSETGSVYQTEVKISIMNQKLLTCQDYCHKIALAKVSERGSNRIYNSRYIKPPVSDALKTKEYDKFKIDEEVPLFLYTCNNYKTSSLLKDSMLIFPVRDNLSVQPRSESFQLQDTSRSRRGHLFIKSRPYNEMLLLGGSRRI